MQLTDVVTTRRCALRIDPSDLDLTLERLLDKYLKHPQLDTLREERRITEDSEEILTGIQDLVYLSSDSGETDRHVRWSRVPARREILGRPGHAPSRAYDHR